MAKLTSILKLVADLDKDLPALAEEINGDLLKIFTESECKIFKAVGTGISAFTEAEITEADQEALDGINADLAKSQEEWDQKRSGVIVSAATAVATLAQKHAKDPAKLTEAVVKAEAGKAKDLAKITEDQAKAEADLAKRKREITDKQSIAAMQAVLDLLKYSKTGNTTPRSSATVGKDHLLVVDLLKTRSGHGILYTAPDRSLSFMPIHADWTKHKCKPEIGKMVPLSVKLVDHKDLKTATGLQSWTWGFIDRAGESDDLDANAERMNKITINGNLKGIGPIVNGQETGNTGGSASVYRIVDPPLDGQELGKHEILWSEAEEKYQITKPTEAEAEDQPTEAEAEDQPTEAEAES